jgi:ATP-binding protein involved in chromosome partitioning
VTPTQLKALLAQVKYPGFSRDIVSFGLVKTAAFAEGTAKIALTLTTADPKVPLQLKREVEACLLAQPGITNVIIDIAVTAPKKPAAPGGGNLAGGTDIKATIRYAVAIASGKGGVGKSTFAVNLACALAAQLTAAGRPGRVGLMDCDIYGPSVPLMMGLSGRPQVQGDNLVPMAAHGVKVMSMGFLIDDNTPVVWRGPMIMKTVQQFVQNVIWGELDLLLIDLPPGTGDAQLSLVQTIPLDGAVLVTTPQPAATNIARKGGLMFQKVNVPLLGVAENMSYFTDSVGVRHALFGEGGGAAIAASLGTDLLGHVPLVPHRGGRAGRRDRPSLSIYRPRPVGQIRSQPGRQPGQRPSDRVSCHPGIDMYPAIFTVSPDRLYGVTYHTRSRPFVLR